MKIIRVLCMVDLHKQTCCRCQRESAIYLVIGILNQGCSIKVVISVNAAHWCNMVSHNGFPLMVPVHGKGMSFHHLSLSSILI